MLPISVQHHSVRLNSLFARDFGQSHFSALVACCCCSCNSLFPAIFFSSLVRKRNKRATLTHIMHYNLHFLFSSLHFFRLSLSIPLLLLVLLHHRYSTNSWLRKWMLTSRPMYTGGRRIQMRLHRWLGRTRLFHSIGNEL